MKANAVIGANKLTATRQHQQNECAPSEDSDQPGLFLRVMYPKDAEGIANSVDPDQTIPDLDLHCLPRLVRPKT